MHNWISSECEQLWYTQHGILVNDCCKDVFPPIGGDQYNRGGDNKVE